MEKQSKAKAWLKWIATNIALLACFLLMYYVSSVCSKRTRIIACLIYAVLWGMNSGMLLYRDTKAKDPVAFSHSNVAKNINMITMLGVLVLCGIFFMMS
jgi:glucan phosphoethanolaminetransferase (alkaline phosphatase superfamily)